MWWAVVQPSGGVRPAKGFTTEETFAWLGLKIAGRAGWALQKTRRHFLKKKKKSNHAHITPSADYTSFSKKKKKKTPTTPVSRDASSPEKNKFS